ncbi:hypothetical protein PUN28_002813 [Cardiocondyla obscurior]|uniref:Uncharacterized protein n=1 Tax=Cardiocondyla obscurior TaxID=286306 RepID=A0AAW2GWC7_9HYME
MFLHLRYSQSQKSVKDRRARINLRRLSVQLSPGDIIVRTRPFIRALNSYFDLRVLEQSGYIECCLVDKFPVVVESICKRLTRLLLNYTTKKLIIKKKNNLNKLNGRSSPDWRCNNENRLRNAGISLSSAVENPADYGIKWFRCNRYGSTSSGHCLLPQ